MDNPEKLATQATQDEDKKTTTKKQIHKKKPSGCRHLQSNR